MLKLCKIQTYPNGTLGLHLSRAPWDPYPWVSGVQDGSNAYQAGVRTGDTVLELNDCDVLGHKISELAAKIQSHWKKGCRNVTMLIWRNKTENTVVNQDSLQKFAKCLQNVAQLLECPICLEIVKPPGWQCCNGHVLCNSCRGRTVKCPICRVTLGPRGRCLLSDKLFTLLAESFPCDGVKNNNSSSKNYSNDCHETPLIKTMIDNSPRTSSSCSSSSSSSPTLEKVYQRKQLTEKAILNYLRKPNNNNNSNNNNKNNNKLSVGSKSRTPEDEDDDDNNNENKELESDDDGEDEVEDEDVNNVVLKLNQKSKKKNDFVDDKQYNSSCSSPLTTTPPPLAHQHLYHDHQQHQNLPQSHHCCALLGQQELTFHCPTGKSLCSSDRPPDPESDPDSKVKTLDCIWTHDISRTSSRSQLRSHPRLCRRKLKGDPEDDGEEGKFETSGKFITKWDILSHLTQVHQISVAQHYTDFGQAVRLQLLQNLKSIPCITIQSERNWTRDKQNLMQAFMSSGIGREKVQGHEYKTTIHPKNVLNQTTTELFFVACIPLDEEDQNEDGYREVYDESRTFSDGNLKEEEAFHRNSMNDVVHADPRNDIPPSYDVVGNTSTTGPPPSPSSSSSSSVVVASPQGAYTGVIKTETNSKSTRKGTHSQTTGYLILDPDRNPNSEKSKTSSPSRYVKHCPTNSHARTGYRNTSLGVDTCTWSSFQSSSLSSSPSSSSSSSSSPSSSSSSLASYSMSSSTSSHCCCSSPSDTLVNRQHAIFIWYFGSDCDVKNFQTVIECKRTGLKWTGCVHPLTKSWSSLQRQQQQAKQEHRHMEQQFLVLNSMPDGGDNFFDILIQTK
ncbi:uncharacterized protein LOC129953657 [Eupeodes corollae]|uniref:uncharacterized protein LOC129953657 n=1 Tax=Eupeodes corollae TaxID=290404 RepID=UPI00249339F4|nr:uncharacterized protein LOC129953657 [Eupeodes corollae]